MIVAGGTYEEICRDPARYDLVGSGVRAAAAIRSVATGLRLASAIDSRNAEEAALVTGGLDLPVLWVERSEPVSFTYLTPLSAPLMGGTHATVDRPIVVESETALVFGMLEGQPQVRAGALVFDPQQPSDLTPLELRDLKYDRLAIVANASETRALGGVRIVEDAARRLLDSTRAEVVVTKEAARGALVTSAEHQERVGAYPTERVWPIGSGDVFAAGFAWAWLEEGASPTEAARCGSRASAHWCREQRLDMPAQAFKDETLVELKPKEGQVYLAGPFFDPAQRWMVNLIYDNLRSLGGNVFSPLHDVGTGHAVAEADLVGLDESTAVLALLDHSDPGTLFEVGWARRAGMPVVGFASRPDEEALKMLRGTDVEMHDDLSSAVYRALWASMGA